MNTRRKKLLLASAGVLALIAVGLCGWAWPRRGNWYGTVDGRSVEIHVFEGQKSRLWVVFPNREWESDIVWNYPNNDAFPIEKGQGFDLNFFLVPQHDRPHGVSYTDTTKSDDRIKLTATSNVLTITLGNNHTLVLHRATGQ
jgi:hypothetical protein